MNQDFPLPAKLIDVHNHLAPEDAQGDNLVALMDSLNVETTLVLGLDYAHNAKTLDAVRKHPGRLVGGVFADPRDGRAIHEVRKCHAEGFRFVKLFPNLGYYPDDDQFRPFFDEVANLRMAVLSHCGFLAPTKGVSAAYYSHPGRFEKLLRTYTDTPFVFAHMGGIAGFLETIMLTTRLPNAYADFSPGQGTWVLNVAPAMVATIPADKLLWGADSYHGIPDQLKANQQALIAANHGPAFDKIFHDNAKELFQRLGAKDNG
jgi:predicted TIM-barrel fold metal-dependent hydrolase